jgi:hypothetical protein
MKEERNSQTHRREQARQGHAKRVRHAHLLGSIQVGTQLRTNKRASGTPTDVRRDDCDPVNTFVQRCRAIARHISRQPARGEQRPCKSVWGEPKLPGVRHCAGREACRMDWDDEHGGGEANHHADLFCTRMSEQSGCSDQFLSPARGLVDYELDDPFSLVGEPTIAQVHRPTGLALPVTHTDSLGSRGGRNIACC